MDVTQAITLMKSLEARAGELSLREVGESIDALYQLSLESLSTVQLAILGAVICKSKQTKLKSLENHVLMLRRDAVRVLSILNS